MYKLIVSGNKSKNHLNPVKLLKNISYLPKERNVKEKHQTIVATEKYYNKKLNTFYWNVICLVRNWKIILVLTVTFFFATVKLEFVLKLLRFLKATNAFSIILDISKTLIFHLLLRLILCLVFIFVNNKKKTEMRFPHWFIGKCERHGGHTNFFRYRSVVFCVFVVVVASLEGNITERKINFCFHDYTLWEDCQA